MQRSFEDTPCRPPACPSLSIRQPFQGTPWLPSDQDKMQKYEINMPVDLISEPVSQPDDKLFVDKSVRPKRTLQAAYAKPVPPLAVSWHQEDNSATPPMQYQPRVHVQATANPPQDLPVIIHMSSASSIQPTTLTTNSQASMHSNVVTIQTPLALANGLPNDMPHSPNYLYTAPVSAASPKTHLSCYSGANQVPLNPSYPLPAPTCASPSSQHRSGAAAVLPQTNLIAMQAPPSSSYGVPLAMSNTQPDSHLPPAATILSETNKPQRTDFIPAHEILSDRLHPVHSSHVIVPSSSSAYAPIAMSSYSGSHMYAQQPHLVPPPHSVPLHLSDQKAANSNVPALSTVQPSFTQTHQVRNVQVFSGGSDCKVLIEDWIRDMQYLLDAGAMPQNLCFATIVRHLSGEARKLVLNLPPQEQYPGRAFEELRAEYSDMQTSLDPLADFYERCQRPGEAACSYAIALESTLRSVEETQYGGQPFPDRDAKLTRQFMRGLSDEEVYHRLAPMKPRLLSFRELQAELRNLARETKKFQMQPKAKKTYNQVQFTHTNGHQSGENLRTEKGNRSNTDLSELTALVKKLVSSQEDQISRLTQLEARFGALPNTVSSQRPQGVYDDASRAVVCYRCGKPGHIARLCRTVLTDDAGGAEGVGEARKDLNA